MADEWRTFIYRRGDRGFGTDQMLRVRPVPSPHHPNFDIQQRRGAHFGLGHSQRDAIVSTTGSRGKYLEQADMPSVTHNSRSSIVSWVAVKTNGSLVALGPGIREWNAKSSDPNIAEQAGSLP